jgi:hypothetical protein
MNAVEELEDVVTLNQAQQLVDFDPSPAVEAVSSTQQLLDELLGRFEDDDSPLSVAHFLAREVCADPDE